ncbi:TNT domain-containing protein [Clostridium vitabionis]|uniref:TNT domain-containing protein n=1 Tax=Clostridium vitabionis TaxID=2784388 RepID=UPI001A9A9323
MPKGTLLWRFGNPEGKFTTKNETEYNELSLPWKIETVEFHVYIVISGHLTVQEIPLSVQEGRSAAMFGRKGGGVQYMHFRNMNMEMREGFLQEVIYDR